MVFRGKVVWMTAQETADEEELRSKSGNRAGDQDTQTNNSGTAGGIGGRAGTGSSKSGSGDIELSDSIGWTTAREQQQEERPTLPEAETLEPMNLKKLLQGLEGDFGAIGEKGMSKTGTLLWAKAISTVEAIHVWTKTTIFDAVTSHEGLWRLRVEAERLSRSCDELCSQQVVASWVGCETMEVLVWRMQLYLPLLEEVRWMWKAGIPTGLHGNSSLGELLVRDPYDYEDYLTAMMISFGAEEGEEGELESCGEEVEAWQICGCQIRSWRRLQEMLGGPTGRRSQLPPIAFCWSRVWQWTRS